MEITGNTLFDCQQMFRHACAFADCADFAMQNFNPQLVDVEWYSTPAAVNSAFACEVFLKALLLYFGIPKSNQHNLKKLYDRLPDKTKDWVKQTVLLRYGAWSDAFGLELLDSISDTFVKWRYSYEHDPKKTCSLQNNISFLMAFRNTLRETCCQLFYCKTWEEHRS